MSTQNSRPDLDAILARASAATPGPWENSSGKGTGAVSAPSSHCAVYQNIRTVEIDDTVSRWQADATFIAHARTDIPELVAYARRLENALFRYAVHRTDPSDDRCKYINSKECTCGLNAILGGAYR
jgi:hypothetical protein